MALLYLLDDDIAVDEQGLEWDLIDGAWRPREEWQPPQLRLVVTDPVERLTEDERTGNPKTG